MLVRDDLRTLQAMQAKPSSEQNHPLRRYLKQHVVVVLLVLVRHKFMANVRFGSGDLFSFSLCFVSSTLEIHVSPSKN